jgi:hypothetical protein
MLTEPDVLFVFGGNEGPAHLTLVRTWRGR